jgi:O-antigen ligase
MINILLILSVFLLVSQFMMRLIINGDTSTFGQNLLIHSLIWVGVFVWLVFRVVKGGFRYLFTGLEIPFAILVPLFVYSFFNAAFKLPAASYGFAYLSFILLLIWMINIEEGRLRFLFTTLLSSLTFVLVVYSLLQLLFLLDIARQEYWKDPTAIPIAPELREEFRWRLMGDEIFATFILSNTFAGFLVIVIPIFVGILIDMYRHFVTNPPLVAMVARMVLIGLCGIALMRTGSKGGYIALLVGGLTFAGCILWRDPRGRKAVKLGMLCALILGALLYASGMFTRFYRTNRSLQVRSTYFGSAIRIIQDYPLAGVGLGNFADYHTYYKGEEQNESQKVHNDYLQIWAELGSFGILGFLLIWVILFSRALRSKGGCPQPLPARTGYIPWVVAVGGLACFLLAYFMAGTFNDFGENVTFSVVLWGVMMVFYLLVYRSEMRLQNAQRYYTRIGVLSGLVCFLVHIMVDFDFYVLGLAETVFFVAAVLILFCDPQLYLHIRIPRVLTAVGALMILVALIPMFFIVLPTTLKYGELMGSAVRHYRGGDTAGAERMFREACQLNWLNMDMQPYMEMAGLYYHKWRRSIVKTRLSHPELMRLFRAIAVLKRYDLKDFKEALLRKDPARGIFWWSVVAKEDLSERELKKAWHTIIAEANLKEMDMRRLLASSEYARKMTREDFKAVWKDVVTRRWVSRAELTLIEDLMQSTLTYIKQARQARPTNYIIPAFLGHYLSNFSEFYARISDAYPEVEPKSKRYLQQAIHAYRDSVRLYPTNAPARYRYGLILEKAGRLDMALVQYRLAVRLSEKAREAKLTRLMIPEDALERIRSRL